VSTLDTKEPRRETFNCSISIAISMKSIQPGSKSQACLATQMGMFVASFTRGEYGHLSHRVVRGLL
jgi:hypothetical protein